MSEQSQDDSGLTTRVGGGAPQAPAEDESVTDMSHGSQSAGSQSAGDGGGSGGQGASQVDSERDSGETFGEIDTLDS